MYFFEINFAFTEKKLIFDSRKWLMIQEFRVSNFLSFKDETVLSFEPVGAGRRNKVGGKGKEDSLLYKVNDKTELLRLAVFYGANASGKTNILKAINFLVRFCQKKEAPSGAETGVIPFKLNSVTRVLPSKFSLRFFYNGTRYWYSLELDAEQVLSEQLYVYRSPQPTTLFKRIRNTIDFNPSENQVSSTAKELLELNCLSNLSFFAAKAKVNIHLNHIDSVMRFFEESFMESEIENDILFTAAEEYISKYPDAKKHLLNFLKEADFNITEITSKKEEILIPSQIRDAILADPSSPASVKDHLKEKSSFSRIKTLFTHRVDTVDGIEEYIFPSREESLGTRRIFGLENYLYVLEETGGIAVLDEIDSSLHPKLVDFVISKFAQYSDSSSQLIVTTHYTGLLDNPDLRDDCFWITEKDKSGATSLRSVGKIKDPRLTSKEKGYRHGKLGGIPSIGFDSEPTSGEERELTLFDF